MLYLPRYDEITELGEALLASDALTPAQHATVGEWRAAHERAMAHRAEVERFPHEAAALIERWHGLRHRDDPGAVIDPADPRRRAWRNEVAAARTRARAMRSPGSVHTAHRAALPDAEAALRRAAADLDDIVRADACRAFDWLARDTEGTAEESGTIAFYAPRYRELAAQAQSLTMMDGLPDADRQRLAAWRTAHDACLRRRAEIQALPARAAAARSARDAGAPWRHDAAECIEAGRALLTDAPGDRPHLDAMPGMRNRIAEALAPLARAFGAAEGAHILPCRDLVLAGDRIRCTVHGRSAFSLDTGGERWRIEGEVETVRHRSLVSVRIAACAHERGPEPGSVVRLTMDELLEFDCMRMPSADEDARARLEAQARREHAEAEERFARHERERRRARDIDRGMHW